VCCQWQFWKSGGHRWVIGLGSAPPEAKSSIIGLGPLAPEAKKCAVGGSFGNVGATDGL